MVKVTILRKFKTKYARQTTRSLTIKRIKSAEIKTRNTLIQFVAKKSGKLRKGVEKALQKEVAQLSGRKRVFSISLRKGLINYPSYARYHIHPGSKFGSSYMKPTVLGTKPVDVRVWNRRLSKNIIEALPEFGFKVSGQ